MRSDTAGSRGDNGVGAQPGLDGGGGFLLRRNSPRQQRLVSPPLPRSAPVRAPGGGSQCSRDAGPSRWTVVVSSASVSGGWALLLVLHNFSAFLNDSRTHGLPYTCSMCLQVQVRVTVSLPHPDGPTRQVWGCQCTAKGAEALRVGEPGPRSCNKDEAKKQRLTSNSAFDLGAFDDSSCPIAASGTHTFVFTGSICKALVA